MAFFADRRRVVAVILIVLLLSAFAVARVRWQTSAARLRAGDVSRGLLTIAEVDPHVALGGDGHAAVSFMGVSHEEGEGDAARFIGARISNDGGASWGELQSLIAPDHRFSTDSMVLSDRRGGFVITWLAFHQKLARGGDPYDLEIYMARADAKSNFLFGGPQWVTQNVRGNDKFLRVDKPWTAVLADGSLATSYRVEGSLSARIQVSRTADGIHFDHTTVAEGHPFGGTLATICADPKEPRAWVAWVDGSRGPFADVVLYSSNDLARTFAESTRRVISRAEEHAVSEAPQCVAENGSLWVAYGIGSAPADDSSSAAYDALVVAHSSDAGATIDARWEAREPGHVMLHPAFARLPTGDFEVLALVGVTADDEHGSVRRFRFGPDGTPRGPSTATEEGVRLVRKRAPLLGWTGDFFGIATSGDRGLYAFGVNGGAGANSEHGSEANAGAAHLQVRAVGVSAAAGQAGRAGAN